MKILESQYTAFVFNVEKQCIDSIGLSCLMKSRKFKNKNHFLIYCESTYDYIVLLSGDRSFGPKVVLDSSIFEEGIMIRYWGFKSKSYKNLTIESFL